MGCPVVLDDAAVDANFAGADQVATISAAAKALGLQYSIKCQHAHRRTLPEVRMMLHDSAFEMLHLAHCLSPPAH